MKSLVSHSISEDIGVEMPDHDAWWPWRSKQVCVLSDHLGRFPSLILE